MLPCGCVWGTVYIVCCQRRRRSISPSCIQVTLSDWTYARSAPYSASNSVRSPIVPTLRLPGIAHVLAVASGKGGVGKTTVAVNLALALRQNGVRVGVFDADLYGPNILLMLGVQRKPSTSKPLNIPVVRTDRSPYILPLERFGLQVMSLGLVLGDTDTIMADGRFAGRMI